MLALGAGFQLATPLMRSSVRSSPLRMQEEPEAPAAEAAEPGPDGPVASAPIGSNPFSMDGIGKPSLGGGKLQMPKDDGPIDESKLMSKQIPMQYLYGVFVLFIIGGYFEGSDTAVHGFRMPGM